MPLSKSLSHCLTELFPIYQNKDWTIRRQNDRFVDPAFHRIILKIDGFQKFSRNHNLFDFLGACCKSVKGKETAGQVTFGGWEVGRKNKFVYYKLQKRKFNGKVHYISRDGKNAIWYSRSGNWHVGLAKNKGTKHASFYLKSKSDCPTGNANTWKYAPKYSGDKKWHRADKGFSIYCTKNKKG